MYAIYLNALYHVIPTKWRSCRDHRLCDVTLRYVLTTMRLILTAYLLCNVLNSSDQFRLK